MKYRVTASSLNLRSGPSTSATSLKTIPMGATVEAVDTSEWMLVIANGASGWMNRKYLEELKTDPSTKPGWRVAASLETMLRQVDGKHPKRNKAFDGTIGDTSHQARASDHNPNGLGVVTARDITHDPEHGFDAAKFAEVLRLSRDPRLKYVIHNGKMFSSLVQPWVWRAYKGADPHKHHVHVSVDAHPRLYDDASPWKALA